VFGVFHFKLWLHYAVPHTALALGIRTDRVQASHPAVLISSTDSSAISDLGSPQVVWCWDPSASLLWLIVIACCLTHPSFSHWWLSFFGHCFLAEEHCHGTSRGRCHWLFLRNIWRPISSVFSSPIPLWCLHSEFVILNTIISLFSYFPTTVWRMKVHYTFL